MTTPQPARLPLLVIEDEVAVMSFVKAALERGGYDVVIARSGSEGIRQLRDGQQYYGIVSDMRMPGGVSGADVHAWLEANRPDLARRIIFITGDTVNPETMAMLKKAGAPCIEKPFRVQQLLNVIEKTLGGGQ